MSISRAPSITDNSENNWFSQLLMMIMVVVGLVLVIDYFRKKMKYNFKYKIDNDGFSKEDKFKQENLWDKYSQARLLPFSGITDHTSLFFKEIDKELENEFKSSTKQIIQFGICNGEYVSNIIKNKDRKVIGYDYSSSALKQLTNTHNIETRMVNLNAINSDNELNYQKQLENDFSNVSDVLLIRILEYLNPEAAKLLIISMMDLAKPDSCFYLEISSPSSDKTDPSGLITIVHTLKPGAISSLFSNRKDLTLEVLDTSKAGHIEQGNTLERLIIRKNS